MSGITKVSKDIDMLRVSLLAALLLATTPCWCFSGRVVSITDGDTIRVLHNGITTKVRLANVDAPEHNQAFGQRAKLFTSAYVFNKVVDVDSSGNDRYGRTIGEVAVPGNSVDLNHALVICGLAWCYRRYCHDPSFYSLEASAKENHIGLWIDPHPTPPWGFRRYEKLQKHLALNF